MFYNFEHFKYTELKFTKCLFKLQTGKTLMMARSDCFIKSILIWVILLCLSRHFWQTTSVQNFRASTEVYFCDNSDCCIFGVIRPFSHISNCKYFSMLQFYEYYVSVQKILYIFLMFFNRHISRYALHYMYMYCKNVQSLCLKELIAGLRFVTGVLF